MKEAEGKEGSVRKGIASESVCINQEMERKRIKESGRRKSCSEIGMKEKKKEGEKLEGLRKGKPSESASVNHREIERTGIKREWKKETL